MNYPALQIVIRVRTILRMQGKSGAPLLEHLCWNWRMFTERWGEHRKRHISAAELSRLAAFMGVPAGVLVGTHHFGGNRLRDGEELLPQFLTTGDSEVGKRLARAIQETDRMIRDPAVVVWSVIDAPLNWARHVLAGSVPLSPKYAFAYRR